MFRSLKVRLALSHTLPVLVFVPLLGVALLYQLERYYLLDNLAVELAAQGAIIAAFTRDEQMLWQNPALAQLALAQLQEQISAHMMLIDHTGHIVAATWFDDNQSAGTVVNSPVVTKALQGEPGWTVDYSQQLKAQVVDVAVPVSVVPGQVIGVIRLSHSLDEIQRRLTPVRWLVLVTLFAGAGLSLALGLVLARSIGSPLLRLTSAVARFTPTMPPESVPETVPDEIKSLAATYNRMSLRLYELERTRTALLSGIVHELGRPLGAIKAAAQTIHNNQDLLLNVELAAGIDEQVDQLRLHIDDLALLGEMELQGLNMAFEPVDLIELIHKQCEQFRNLAIEKKISYTCAPDRDLPLISADPKRISQILGNLFHNACKYTPTGGQVQIFARIQHDNAYPNGSQQGPNRGKNGLQKHAKYTGNQHDPASPPFVEVQIVDSGPGIDPDEQERIFQFFYRSPSQRRVQEGMGIGLALARQLTEAHGGSLTVQSQVGQGATFTVLLPVKQETPTKALPKLTAGPVF